MSFGSAASWRGRVAKLLVSTGARIGLFALARSKAKHAVLL